MRTGGHMATTSEPRTCGHCGADDVGTLRAGCATMGDGTYLCHPYTGDRADCYRLVTIYHHPMPCSDCRNRLWALS